MDSSIYTAALVAIAAQIYLSPIPEVSSIKVLRTYCFANIGLSLYYFSHTTIVSSTAHLVILNFTFLATAVLLTLVRRVFFSPLAAFPGPRLYALTNLFKANLYRTGKGAYTLLDLHNKYHSDIIRIGPNELSVRNVEAVERLYKGKYPRGTVYDAAGIDGATSLNTERDYNLQSKWRRVWEMGFASSQFKDYNPRVERHTSKLLEVIRSTKGKEVNILRLMENYVFDVMADLSFAHEAKMQDGTKENDYMNFLHKFMSAFATIGALRSTHELLPYIPMTADMKKHQARGKALLSHRLKLGKSRRDILTHLLEAEIEIDTPPGRTSMFTPEQLYSNSNMVLIAGTDTTSSTMTQLFRALALNPAILKKVQREVDGHCDAGKDLSVEGTKSLEYTIAVVNEAVRLFNPLSSGIFAATPSSGLVVPEFGNPDEEVFIPGHVQVMIPHVALMTDERYFAKANEFIPERWTGEWSEGVRDRRAYIPFGYGVHSCVGKQLALNEMRIVVANVVREWDIVLGERYDEHQWMKAFRDFYTLKLGDLWGKFVPRG